MNGSTAFCGMASGAMRKGSVQRFGNYPGKNCRGWTLKGAVTTEAIFIVGILKLFFGQRDRRV